MPASAASTGAARAEATLLLPARTAFAGQALPNELALALGRADAVHAEPGDRAQLQRHFTLLPRAWPVAALTRAVDAPDAGGAQWLRADPAWIRPDINGARLFAAGEGLRLARGDADALLPALRPLFGDAGMPIDAPDPSRWYVRTAPGTRIPAFAEPADVLGSELGDALVEDAGNDPEARRWRALLSEAQVVLHNHPWNAQRAAQGKPPVNSLWFWGGGALPDQVTGTADNVWSGDTLLLGLASRAGAGAASLPSRFEAPAAGHALFDLRASRDLAAVAADWLRPATQALRDGKLGTVQLDFADGAGLRLAQGQRWRFWRRPRVRLL